MGQATAELESWGTFFAALAEASGVLLGLLFVAVSLLSGGVFATGAVGLMVNQSGIALLYPLLTSLAMLIPSGSPWVQGLTVALLGAAGIFGSLLAASRLHKIGALPSVGERLRRDVPAALGSLLYVVGGVLVIADRRIGIFGIALASFLMIVVGTRNTWGLLLERR